ncbi:MAG: pectate lyase [Sedimentisphaerales bacterium]|nr:pectate lyase [Sedimentisphaerales bacterium]
MKQRFWQPDKRIIFASVIIIGLCTTGRAAPWWRYYVKQSDDWYRSAEGKRIADNILSWQSVYGSWPKNVNTAIVKFSGDANDIHGTFDNGATTDEMRLLARAFRATQDKRYRQAFLKALDHILQAQYASGGWPQFYPPSKQYHRHITFNDDTMVRIMRLLLEISTSENYNFIDVDRRKAAKASFDRGIRCILKCQIRVNGKLTVWCAQHDEIDYRPRPARTYELVSLSGEESVGILKLLMSLDNPDPEVIEAVNAAVQWFESVKVSGIKLRWVNGERIAVEDPNAPVLWARFYEIETNRPFFCGRDGIKKYDYNSIEAERRDEYEWYGNWPGDVASDYAKWKQKWLPNAREK